MAGRSGAGRTVDGDGRAGRSEVAEVVVVVVVVSYIHVVYTPTCGSEEAES